MNKIYKTIHNTFTGDTAVACELAKSQGKGQNIVTRQNCLISGVASDEAHYFGAGLKIKITLATLVLSSLPVFAQAGETITFPGSSLRADPRMDSEYAQIDTLAPVSSLSDNTIIINSGNIPGSVFSGVSPGDADVFNNRVTLSKGSALAIYGGFSRGGNVFNNKIIITDGTVTANMSAIYGGMSYTGKVNGNSVSISGGSVNGTVYGGMALGNSGVTNNKVTLSGNASVDGMVIGGWGPGSISNNTVTISDNVSVKHVFGGYVENGAGEARNNSVIMTGGRVEGNIAGGFGRNSGAPSIGNHVIISGGTVGGNVFAGFSRLAPATDNSITLSGNPKFSPTDTALYGGVSSTSYADVFSGNTLNFNAKPIAVNKVANFEHYNFTLDPALANISRALINTDTIVLGNGKGTTSTFTVVGVHSGPVLQTDDKFLLIQARDMSGDGVGITSRGVAQQGISLLYDIRTDVNLVNHEVTATVLSATDSNENNNRGVSGLGNDNKKLAAHVNPQLKALSAGYLAGVQLVTRGADMIVEDVFSAIKVQEQEQGGPHLFVVGSGGHTQYNGGSHIKSNDFLFTGGVNYEHNNLTVGTFIEGGLGNYDTYNSFYNAANVHGDGNNRYYGAGLLGRYDFDNGFYTDTTIRFGQTQNKFDTQDILNLTTGQFASYDLKSNYVSTHIGVGNIMQISDKNQLDLSAKYLWTQLGGKDVNVADDNIHFDRVNSHRARINATLNSEHSKTLTLNAGLSYEYEFDGKANATTYGNYQIDAASVKGGTGIVSLGATVKPTSNHHLTLDFKANGYRGKREGIGASIRTDYAF